MISDIPMIITAAGYATRNPGKLCYPLNGKAVIVHTVESVLKFHHRVVVVLGHDKVNIESILQAQFSGRISITENSDYSTGMSSSIQKGLKELNGASSHFGILPGDKPFIEASVFSQLLKVLKKNNNKIIVPQFNGQTGHPVYFPEMDRNRLLALTGDVGGKLIIDDHPERVIKVQTGSKKILIDMDAYFESNAKKNRNENGSNLQF